MAAAITWTSYSKNNTFLLYFYLLVRNLPNPHQYKTTVKSGQDTITKPDLTDIEHFQVHAINNLNI